MTKTTELIQSSAKELEHYQRVRKTFEAPDQKAPPNFPIPPAQHNEQHSFRPKFKTRTSTKDSGKGKGKAIQWNSEDDEDEDEAYVTSNDYTTPDRYRSTNGSAKGKGVVHDASMNHAFGDANPDDEGLYE